MALPCWSGFNPVSLLSAWQRRYGQGHWMLGCHPDSKGEGRPKEPPTQMWGHGSCLSPPPQSYLFQGLLLNQENPA